LDAPWTLANAFTASRLDYCNPVFYEVMHDASQATTPDGDERRCSYGMAVTSTSISHQCCAMSHLGEYRLKLHSLHLTVSEMSVLHISSTSAYRQRISLAELVSAVRNVEIWSCREQQRNSANEVSAVPLRSSGTVFRTICARPLSPNRARQLYKNISMLFLFPVKRDLLFTNI